MQFTDYQAIVSRFTQTIGHLFHGTTTATRLQGLVARLQHDCREIESNRGLDIPTVGFVGPKNSGKSFLLRLLVTEAAVREQIPSGIGAAGRTERLLWVGATRPDAWEPATEFFLRCETGRATRLQRPLVLVDVPGFTDSHEAARLVSRRALTSCQLKVFVVREANVEAETIGREAQEMDGADILPVVNGLEDVPESSTARHLADTLVDMLQRHAPHARILPPLLVPHLRVTGQTRTEQEIAEHVASALNEALDLIANAPAPIEQQIATRIDRFRLEVRSQLSDFVKEMAIVVDVYDHAVAALPHTVLQDIVGSERTTTAGVRLGMRAQIVHCTPAIFFPHRSVLGMLTLTTGAWDRLALAFSGRVPSLALMSIQALRNVRALAQVHTATQEGLTQRLAESAQQTVREPLAALCRTLDQVAGTEEIRGRTYLPNLHIHGLDRLEQASVRIFEEETTTAAPSPRIIRTVGFLGCVTFFTLLSGPLYALYRQYGKATWQVFTQQEFVAWSAFPAPDFTRIVTAVFLSMVPVFLLAGLLLGFSTMTATIQRCVERIRQRHEQEMSSRVRHGTLRFEVDDQRLESARWLLGFLRRSLESG